MAGGRWTRAQVWGVHSFWVWEFRDGEDDRNTEGSSCLTRGNCRVLPCMARSRLVLGLHGVGSGQLGILLDAGLLLLL
jgi:hypothetical protein